MSNQFSNLGLAAVGSPIKPAIHVFVSTLVDASSGKEGYDEKYNTILSSEYGKMDDVLELQKVLLEKCGYPIVRIHNVTLANYVQIIDSLSSSATPLVVFNLCDGTEADGYPGISINRYLEKKNIPYTGADSFFFDATTSKIDLKTVLQKKGVSTSPFKSLQLASLEADLEDAEKIVGPYPMIVKPSISYASLCITDKSVVHDREEARKQALSVLQADEGKGGVFVERFLAGREFTALVVGDEAHGTVRVFTVAERAFDQKLETEKRILAFDRYWNGYDLNGSAPANEERLYSYQPAPASVQGKLSSLAKAAYLALGGKGYGRVDIRTDCYDLEKMEAFVLEVNANCGFSFGSSSSMGEILRLSFETPQDFVNQIIGFAQSDFK